MCGYGGENCRELKEMTLDSNKTSAECVTPSRLCPYDGDLLETVSHSASVLLEFGALFFNFRAILAYLHNRTSFSFSLFIGFGPEVF